jgi:hypothetical protein
MLQQYEVTKDNTEADAVKDTEGVIGDYVVRLIDSIQSR